MSALLGIGSPLGWLCTKIILGASIFTASASTSFGVTIAKFAVP